MDVIELSLERVINALTALGLRRIEAELYVFLTKKKTQTTEELGQAFNIEKNKINSYLLNLEKLELVSKNKSVISALPFEEALEVLIDLKKKQTEDMKTNKEELLTD